MKKDNRILFIDIARGIAILLMIVGHITNTGTIRSLIYSFHMPLFIIVSGFFYKERTIKEEIKQSFYHLILPTSIVVFIITFIQNINSFNVIDSLIESLKTIAICWSHQSKITYNFLSTKSLWFVYMLVLIKILFNITKKISKENKLFLLGLILLQTYIGYLIGINGYWLTWSIDISFACMAFYYFGYILNKTRIINKIIKDTKLLILIYLFWLIGTGFNNIEIAIRSYPNGLWSYITAICGSMLILKLANIIEKKCNKLAKILSWCGENSLYILIIHYIETALIKYNITPENIELQKTIIITIKLIISTSFALVLIKIKEHCQKYILNIVKKQTK